MPRLRRTGCRAGTPPRMPPSRAGTRARTRRDDPTPSADRQIGPAARAATSAPRLRQTAFESRVARSRVREPRRRALRPARPAIVRSATPRSSRRRSRPSRIRHRSDAVSADTRPSRHRRAAGMDSWEALDRTPRAPTSPPASGGRRCPGTRGRPTSRRRRATERHRRSQRPTPRAAPG